MSSLSRRTFLRGAGVAVGLPFLEAMLPSTARAAEASPPRRAAFVYVPNGVIHDAWKPATEGADYALPYSLEPLAPVKGDVTVVSGLSQIPYGERSGVGHARPTAALLTGKVADKERVHVGKSVDQILADAVGGETKLPSLQLAITGNKLAGQCDSGYSCAYSSCISWRDATSPMPNDNDPRSVFERLFGKQDRTLPEAERTKRQLLRKSVLDAVLDDARRLERQLGRADRLKLDEYLYSVRQVEKQLDRSAPLVGKDGEPLMQRPPGTPEDYPRHVKLMADLLALAFQTDATRVCTLMLDSAAGGRTYPMIGVREGHHALSHHGNDEEKLAKLRKVDRYNTSLFAHLVQRLKAIPEGDGTLLDHCAVFYGSGLGAGSSHTPFDLPVLVAGRAGGAFQSGRHLRFPMDTPLNNLWVSVMQSMGLPAESFGDSTGPLPLS